MMADWEGRELFANAPHRRRASLPEQRDGAGGETTPPVIQSITVNDGQFTLIWSGGRASYQAQAPPNL